MYRLTTMHTVTDRRTDGQTDRLHYCTLLLADHTACCVQYDRLKIDNIQT